MQTIVVDLDGTITRDGSGDTYGDVQPRTDVVEKLRQYSKQGFKIVIFTARNMRSYSGSIGKITAFTVPTIIDWLKFHDIPFDELHVGKPWCGPSGFYVDDKAIRPSEFLKMEHEEIMRMLSLEEAK